MIKFIKSWKFVFLFTLFILYLVYFGVVYNNELELPSKGWSRNLILTEFNVNSTNEVVSNNNIFSLPIPAENTFLILWHEDNTINYSLINNKGTIISKNKFDFTVKAVKKIRGILENDIISLYSLENKELKKYELDLRAKKIISSKTIAQSVKDFIFKKDLLIYYEDNNFSLLDKSGHKEAIENIDVENFEIIKDENSPLYHIALTEKTNTGEKFLNYLTYNLNNKKLDKYKLTSIANSVKLALNRVDIGIIQGNINILASVTDNRFGTNTLYIFDFDKNDILNFSKSTISINSVKPDPRILKNEKKNLTFIASSNITKGRNTETINIIKYKLDHNNDIIDEKLLTKTNSSSLNPYYFNLNNHDYLISTDINGKTKKIMLSSNDNDIIKASKKLNSSEIIDLFMATFTSLIPSMFISLISIMNIFVPTILFIFVVSIINLRLIENYSNKMFIIILSIHSILKILYSHKHILENYEVHNFLPGFLKNPLSLYLLLAAATLISIYCLKNFLKNSKYTKHLVKSYSFFAFIDLVVYTFLTIPYIYSYLLLTYKINLK